MGRQGERCPLHHLFRPGLLPSPDTLLLQDLPYSDRIKYAEVQKEKPGKGFGTSDFSRRDEFSNTCRTEQYRTQLKVQTCHLCSPDYARRCFPKSSLPGLVPICDALCRWKGSMLRSH